MPQRGYLNASCVCRVPTASQTAKHVPKALGIDDVGAASGAGGAGAGAPAASSAMLPDQCVLSLAECAQLFLDSIASFWSSEERRATLGAAVFDKDDALALDFVTAAANLRAHVFSIPQQSKFDIKSIAGNIIPAIATTNAIVAGLQVRGALPRCHGRSTARARPPASPFAHTRAPYRA